MRPLSPYQKRLCCLRGQGLTGKEIASLLGISHVNVRKKFWEIRRALGIGRSLEDIRESNMLLFSQAAQTIDNKDVIT